MNEIQELKNDLQRILDDFRQGKYGEAVEISGKVLQTAGRLWSLISGGLTTMAPQPISGEDCDEIRKLCGELRHAAGVHASAPASLEAGIPVGSPADVIAIIQAVASLVDMLIKRRRERHSQNQQEANP